MSKMQCAQGAVTCWGPEDRWRSKGDRAGQRDSGLYSQWHGLYRCSCDLGVNVRERNFQFSDLASEFP